MDTIAPASSSSVTAGRFATNNAALLVRHQTISRTKQHHRWTICLRHGQQLPKICVGRNDHLPRSTRVRNDVLIGGGDQPDINHVSSLIPLLAQPHRDPGGQIRVDEEPHKLRRLRKWQLALLHGSGGELQGSQDVGSLQVRVIGEDLLDATPRRELTQHRADRHPGVADARQPAHPPGVDGDPLVRHAFRVREESAHRRSPGENLTPPVTPTSPYTLYLHGRHQHGDQRIPLGEATSPD